MSPLQERQELSPAEWDKLSSEVPPRGRFGRKGSGDYFEVNALKRALQGEATQLTYDAPDEACRAACHIRNRGKGRVRVIQPKGQENTIAVGPPLHVVEEGG